MRASKTYRGTRRNEARMIRGARFSTAEGRIVSPVAGRPDETRRLSWPEAWKYVQRLFYDDEGRRHARGGKRDGKSS